MDGHIGSFWMQGTIDDTFRLLKRTPYAVLRDMLSSPPWPYRGGFDKFLTENGWTREEYLRKYLDTEMPVLQSWAIIEPK